MSHVEKMITYRYGGGLLGSLLGSVYFCVAWLFGLGALSIGAGPENPSLLVWCIRGGFALMALGMFSGGFGLVFGEHGFRVGTNHSIVVWERSLFLRVRKHAHPISRGASVRVENAIVRSTLAPHRVWWLEVDHAGGTLKLPLIEGQKTTERLREKVAGALSA